MTLLAGRYRLDRPIARGGMAVVHHADDEVLKRPVAVKTLVPDRATDLVFRAAVRREAVAAAGLTHPNIARVLDYGEAEWEGVELPFLVMELISGVTLAQHLAEQGPMSWREAAQVCSGVAAAIAAAHDRNLIHHDVKPANIMLSPRGVKVVDFGVACAPGQPPPDLDGRVWGTPAYLSPEQLAGRPATTATDVYALGLVLHACLTGRRAWPGRSTYEVLIARACTPVPRLPESARVPRSVGRIYEACLTRTPKRRPAAHRVAQLLDDVATGRSSRRWTAPSWSRGAARRPGPAVPAASTC